MRKARSKIATAGSTASGGVAAITTEAEAEEEEQAWWADGWEAQTEPGYILAVEKEEFFEVVDENQEKIG